MVYVLEGNLIKLCDTTFNEQLRNHTYSLYAEKKNIMIWKNTTCLVNKIDYLVFFLAANYLSLTHQIIKNFVCQKILISLNYYALIIIVKVVIKYDLPLIQNMKLFDGGRNHISKL